MNTLLMRYAMFLVVLIMVWGFYTPIHAAEADPGVPLSLEACIARMLDYNLDIEAQSIGREIAEQKVLEAMAGSKPSLELQGSVHEARKPTASVLEGGEGRTEVTEETFVWDTNVSQPLPIGGSVGLHFGNHRFETDSEYQTINPVFRSAVSLVWTQPLLKDAGAGVNRAEVHLAQHTKGRTESLFQAYVAELIVEACGHYWNLIYAQADLESKRLAFEQAQQILEMTEADMDEGRRPITDVLEARAVVAARKGEIIAAEETLRNAEDQLKLITNLVDDPAMWERRLVPTTMLSATPQVIDEAACLREARTHRLAYTIAQAEYHALKLRTKLARNALLPSVDLVSQVSLTGIGRQYSDDVNQLKAGDFNTWGVGLTMNVPLGNHAARSILQQRSLEERQMQARMKALEHRITAEVKQAVRHIQTCLEQIEAAKQVREFREKNLDAAQERFGLGMSTSEEVLEAQQDMAEARSSYVKSVAAYNNALIRLEKVKGTLLTKYPAPYH